MKISTRHKQIIYGTLWGDGWLQKTGERNARLRLEHSAKQSAYINWLYRELITIFQRPPVALTRKHPQSQRCYKYLRLQSHSSPLFGDLRRAFYDTQGKKIVPREAARYLPSALTLAIWYMDDGYYYHRDGSAHIYLPAYPQRDLERLIITLREKFALTPNWYCRPDRRGCQLNFTGTAKDKLFSFIRPYIIREMTYKTPYDPVTTASENAL